MSGPANILIVDDDDASRTLLRRVLESEGYTVTAAEDGAVAIKLVDSDTAFDAVVSDIRMVEADGLQVVDAFRKKRPDVPVILVTAFGNVEGAVEAVRRGAFDYISKPYDLSNIHLVLDRALRQRRLAEENRRLKRSLTEKYKLENIVGRSEPMLRVFKTVARVAATDATVLVVGESGTGKELVARAIHNASPRSAGAFVPVDCGAIAEGVLESELFGHAKGAFTGAQAARHGLFEEASGGTLFLDEIGNIGLGLQARLLRVLQEGELRRVGESQPVRIDVRVVAATNRDLEAEVKAGRFREDLFYRLNVVQIRLPPLRERTDDILPLAEHFAARYAGERGAALTTAAREALARYAWPGNVRELENAIARALALSPSGTLLPDDFSEPIARAAPTAVPGDLTADRPTLGELERRYAERVLHEHGGNKTRAAEQLGIDRKTLYRILPGGDDEKS